EKSSRSGTKLPLSPEEFQKAFKEVEKSNRGVAAGVLNKAGRYKLADPNNPLLSNKALGLEKSSRSGTKLPLSPEEFQKAFKEVEKSNRGVAA
ncbi:hypothetical protein QWO81_24140, partial [Salmonella enterica subsp. enterica serovar Typhimurium]|nr:hypothetical protein [Salmonella enterica subsp. enterica serovar Typhimurium]